MARQRHGRPNKGGPQTGRPGGPHRQGQHQGGGPGGQQQGGPPRGQRRGKPPHGKPYHGKPYHGPRPPRQDGPPPGYSDAGPPAGPIVNGEPVQGVLELHPKGYGFLRSPAKSYVPQQSDPYVPGPLISRLHLREGLMLTGPIHGGSSGTGPRLAQVDKIEGLAPDDFKQRDFDKLTAVDPHERIILETGAEPLTTRVMDMLTPIGKGQRGLIVAPPRTGKTILLQHIAQAVSKNHPEMKLFMLLIDERPEEVTEMRRTIKGEVVASSADQDTVSHIRTAGLIMERAKRLAEQGQQSFVLLDSLTRLARAHNKSVGNSGRTMSGGIDIRALEIPKRAFGMARVFDEGGSLTVIGTCLIETGSRMDDIIFEEFKGTGNMELVLNRKLSDRRIYPALDISQSGTRKEERILPAEMLQRITLLRRSLIQMKPVEAMESLVAQLAKYPSNAAFLDRVGSFIR